MPSRIIVIHQIADLKQIENDDYYNEFKIDMRDEAAKYGTLLSIEIPREGDNVHPSYIGRVFVEYRAIQEAKEARKVCF